MKSFMSTIGYGKTLSCVTAELYLALGIWSLALGKRLWRFPFAYSETPTILAKYQAPTTPYETIFYD
jgi:hypothetical protein